jgi:hypothetical protein
MSTVHQSNAELWSTPMTTISPMMRADASRWGYCFVAQLGRAASLYIQHLSRRFIMSTDQHLSWQERGVSDAKGQVPLQASAEFVRTYNARAHEIVDALTAAVTYAEAGLNWLRAEPPDLEGARQALNGIASDGKRAAEIIVRLRAIINEVAHSESSS